MTPNGDHTGGLRGIGGIRGNPRGEQEGTGKKVARRVMRRATFFSRSRLLPVA
ncbi:hypothetical protein Caci_2304 [Catenulispora acidiphila DSM 44928]|uniref:Uncharacterized protein n=1 Tax=Catenulispora acidiphila (strain DSM 44928 / JCM 14897 / NBRC 102108 / NRRL B-24433 / ID139908) TaxID=479433 RepID=C7QJJ9_CATAD|nr:hypothetical protein Caci_2304 [Catenulispora acidiphila DSM 44928]